VTADPRPAPWSASVDGLVFTWTPPGRLDGDAALVAVVLAALEERQEVAVTVTGPWLPSTVEHPAAVLALVVQMHPAAALSGDVPDLTALWVDDLPPDDPEVIFSP
jgi:hypothetical protein